MDRDSPPSVCILQRYLPPDPSGAGILAISLARLLRHDGHEVFLVGDGENSPQETAPDLDLPVVWLKPAPPNPSRRDILTYWLRLLSVLFRHRDRIDVVQIHAVNFMHAGIIPAAKLFGKPVLVRASLEGDLPSPGRSKGEWLHYQLLRFASSFVVISRRLKRQYLNSGIPEDKVAYIPNGVDTDRFIPRAGSQRRDLRRELGLPLDATILTYHGVFVARKSIDWVLPLLEDHLADSDLVLLLIGSPGRDEAESGYFERLQERIARSRASDSILLTGFKEDVHRYLQASDLYLLPSTGEGLPNALLEAMAVGLISVVSRTSGSDEVIEHGVSGFLFEPRDEAAFRRCLQDAIDASRTDRGRDISRAAVERVRSAYSIETVADRYAREYRRVLSRD